MHSKYRFLWIFFLGSWLPAGTQPVLETPHFHFHSHFWVNLHHYLYQKATLMSRSAPQTDPVDLFLPSAPTVEPKEREAILAAMNLYASEWIDKDLLFHPDLTQVKYALIMSQQDIQGVPPSLANALYNIAPVYRNRLWPEQHRTNLAWIEDQAPLIQTSSETMTSP